MTDNKYKSLENLLSISTPKLSYSQLPEHFENYRNELHREMATRWPFRNDASDGKDVVAIVSKATDHSNVHDNNKQNVINNENESLHPTSSIVRSNPVGSTEKKIDTSDRTVSMTSNTGFLEHQQNTEWNLKAQEGIITYQLPDSLSDGFALLKKLQTLMKMNTIYLNDRRFWATLENRFKRMRKRMFHENMKRLRQEQQEYENDLIAKGLIPYTTEEAIKHYAEKSSKITISDGKTENDVHKNCLTNDDNSNKMMSNVKSDSNQMNEEFEAFESDNIHPRLHQIFPDYQYQTNFGKHIGEHFHNELYQNQTYVQTNFPRINQQDRIRQELEAVKTSEGLYAYSNRLTKQ